MVFLRSLWRVFIDAVMANVLVFAVGQVFAWLFLRTGRFWLGAGATVVLWVSIDCWLVQRYVLASPADMQQLALLCLQATAALTTFFYLWACVRKRLAAPRRAAGYRRGIRQLLAGELSAAAETFRGLAWDNPWDPSAWIGRGDACRRLGVASRARRCYRRAASVDVKGQFADLLAHRFHLLQAVKLVADPDPKDSGKDSGNRVILPPSGPLVVPAQGKSHQNGRQEASVRSAN